MPKSKPTAAPFARQVAAVVRSIPRGRLMTYGQIATLLGSPRAARAVGWVLADLPGRAVPWHRVINAQGRISVGGRLERPEEQLALLRREGVRFDGQGRCDLEALRHWPHWPPAGLDEGPAPPPGLVAAAR